MISLGRDDEAQPLLDLAEPILQRHVADHPMAPFDCTRARWGRANLLVTREPAAAAGTRSVELEQVHVAAIDLAFGERLDFDTEFTFVKVKRRK